MYKIASDLAQRRARQLWLEDLQTPEFQALSSEQQRENLVSKFKAMQTELIALPKGSRACYQLGFEIQEVQNAINSIPRPKAKNGLGDYFIKVAKEKLPPAKYESILLEARKRRNEDESL